MVDTMTKWSDIALYRGVLAGFITLMLGSCVGSPLLIKVYGQVHGRETAVAIAWLAAITIGILIALLSRRADQPAKWAAEGKCRQCGYDLTGNVSGICPECGTTLKSENK